MAIEAGPKSGKAFAKGKPRAGTALIVVIVLATVVVAVKVMRGALAPPPAIQVAETRIFVDSETGKSFTARLTAGMTIPITSPYTGRKTGYPAELCYWSKDGHIMSDPTPVLLNSYLGKPGPTFCPYCGRLVVPHNPMPHPGSRPPPTLAEYKAAHPDYTGE